MPLTVGWARDDRDSALVPTAGRYQRVNLDWRVARRRALPARQLQYQQYFPLNKQFTLRPQRRTRLGQGPGRPAVSVFKNFYGGGLGSVRGFEQGSLGPVDVTGAYIGGNRSFNLNAELYLPFPGAGNDRTLRLFGFVDAGNVWGENEKITLRAACAPRPASACQLDLAGRPAASSATARRSASSLAIESSDFQFQIGTAF